MKFKNIIKVYYSIMIKSISNNKKRKKMKKKNLLYKKKINKKSEKIYDAKKRRIKNWKM